MSTPETLELIAKADLFRTHAKVADRSYHFKTYKKCFVANEMIDTLVAARVVESRAAAVEFGRELEDHGLFEHVVDPQGNKFQDKYLFFKFKDCVLPASPPSSPTRGRSSDRMRDGSDRIPRVSRVKTPATCILDDDDFLMDPDVKVVNTSSANPKSHTMLDDESSNRMTNSSKSNNSSNNAKKENKPENKFWRSVTHAVTRSLSPMRGGSDKARARSESPGKQYHAPPEPSKLKRTETGDTAKVEDDELLLLCDDSCAAEAATEQTWEEERFELLERMEALESKLQAKEAVLNSILNAAARGTDTFPTRRSMAPLASMVVNKEKELADLEETVKKQLIRIEQLETQQEQQVKRRAELLFQEWQQEEKQVSVWEQLQEQNERIAQLEAENEYQRQCHQKQQAYNEKLIKQLLEEKKAWREAESTEFTVLG